MQLNGVLELDTEESGGVWKLREGGVWKREVRGVLGEVKRNHTAV